MKQKQYITVDGYMIYGCKDCNKGFTMYLEEGLENGEKPVPFSIQCPFCKGHSCYDVGFKKYPFGPKKYDVHNKPYFANIEGDECGKPTNMEFAKVEFVHEAVK